MSIDTLRADRQRPPLVFTLHIGQRAPDGSYPLRMRLNGATATSHSLLAEADVALELPERLLGRARSLLQPQSQMQGGDEHMMGTFLARQLFPTPVRQFLLHSIAQARERDTSLRIALQIDAPELTTLPWEWLTVAGRSEWSPALLDDYGFVRLVPAPSQTPRPSKHPFWNLFRGATTPLLLLVAPSERDAVLIALKRALRPLVARRVLRYSVQIAPTTPALQRAISKERPAIVHILARAEFERPDAPRLFLDEPLDADGCATMLGDLRPLVVLDGSWRATGVLSAASNRLAYGLVERLLPAVVAFHSPLSPDESAAFAYKLYDSIARGHSLQEALIAGRQGLATRERAPWGLPILVQRFADETVDNTSRGATIGWRSLALSLVAGAVVVALVATRSGGNQQPTPRPPALPTALVDVATPATTNSGLLGFFNITLPTPTVAPAAATPSLGIPTDIAQQTQQEQPAEPTALPPPLAPPQGWTIYLVQPNETVAQIAERMGSDAAAIATLNRVDPAAPLVSGRGLMIPVYQQGEAGIGSLDVNRGRQDTPLVALTFDTEIDDTMLYQICDILRARGLHATFFVTGNWVRAYPDAARAIVANGHELGNHSLTHPNFTAIGLDGAAAEIDRTEEIVVKTTGVSTRPFFRFPYGAKNAHVLQLLGSKGYISYHWTADDNAIPYWITSTAANPQSGNGAILLMHQRAATIAALPGWLDQLAQMGLRPVSLSQILR